MKMEKKSTSMMRRLIHRDSLPQLTFGHQSATKEKSSKTRRKSEGMLTVPEHFAEPKPTPFWYLREIKTRDAAEDLLNRQKVGTYLVRDSETSKLPGSYTLSLRHKDKCRHHKIETNPRNNKLIIKGYENHMFDDLERLVDFFVKSQRKDIYLMPYNPEPVDHEDGLNNTEEQQHAYEIMNSPEVQEDERQEEYQVMDNGNAGQQMKHGFTYPQGGPPPLPTRRDGPSSAQQNSYMNLGPRGAVPPPPLPPQAQGSYENIPPKDRSPPPPSPKDAPPLPPRVAVAGPGSYENIPGRPPPRPRNYENHGTNPKYENYFPKSQQAHSSPGHSYQNLPPKVTPRKPVKTSYSAEQELPPRKPAQLRRTQTDTSSDWQRRGYNM